MEFSGLRKSVKMDFHYWSRRKACDLRGSSSRPQGVVTDVLGLRYRTAETTRPASKDDPQGDVPRETMKRSPTPCGKPLDGAYAFSIAEDVGDRSRPPTESGLPPAPRVQTLYSTYLYQISPLQFVYGTGTGRQYAIQYGRLSTVL
jgi:hypothetical protein